MITLIETSVWIDFTRLRSPEPFKRFLAPYIFDPTAHLAQPVIFELLRDASESDYHSLTRQFETFPILSTPADVWERAATLGRKCRKAGHTAGSLDLMIAVIALAHDAVLVTFDEDFRRIGESSGLQAKILQRPGSSPK